MTGRMLIRTILALALASPLVAQQPGGGAVDISSAGASGLPEGMAEELIERFNDPAAVRFVGGHTISAGDTIRANVAAVDGPLVVAGTIQGDLLMIRGTVRLLPGASISGRITVTEGNLEGVDAARVGGEIVTYSSSPTFRRDGFRLISRDESQDGGADFLVATGKSYNRVEGLPITFGPRIRTSGSNPLRVEALGIYRSEAGLTLDPDEMGYFARIEQFIGGRRAIRIGLSALSRVDPIEDWQLSDLESGLSTFLFHQDFRDHYQRRGFSLYSFWHAPGSPLELGLEAQWEEHESLPPGTPWSLTDNTDPWRAQPLIAEGDVGMVGLRATLDTRSSSDDPATGWYVRGRLERAFESELVLPGALLSDPDQAGEGAVAESAPLEFGLFTAGTIDLRRYNRIDPRSRLNLRLLLGGALDRNGLPPQRQHALGGEGSLPGYPLFELDCGARSAAVFRPNDNGTTRFYPRYGCDAFGLVQAEYRGRFSLRFLWDSVPWADEDGENDDLGFVWDMSPDWAVFVDAARAWTFDQGADEDVRADVGLGIVLNRFGVFAAVPVTGGDGVNVFVRLGPRF